MLALQRGEEAALTAGSAHPCCWQRWHQCSQEPQSCCPEHWPQLGAPGTHPGQFSVSHPGLCGFLECPPRPGMPACLTLLPFPPAWHSRGELCQEASPAAKPARALRDYHLKDLNRCYFESAIIPALTMTDQCAASD